MLAPVMDVSVFFVRLFVKKIVKCGEMEGYRNWREASGSQRFSNSNLRTL
jgi:hypothetical protein